MEKIIVENRTYYRMDFILSLVEEVVSWGRISGDGERYCAVATFKDHLADDEIVIASSKNKASDRFVATVKERGMPTAQEEER